MMRYIVPRITVSFFSNLTNWLVGYPTLREGAKKKISTRDPVFGGSCVPKPLPIKDSNFTGVRQAARKIKRAKIGGQ